MTSSAVPTPSRRWLAWLLFWLAVGLGLRLALAASQRDAVLEWEAEGFVRAFEGWSFGEASRVRPAGLAWLLAALGRLAAPHDLLGLRLASVGLSFLSLAAGWVLVASVVRATRLAQPSAGTGCAWLTAIWALSPTLLEVSVRPVPEAVVGGPLCLLLAAAAAWGQRSSLLRWILLTAALVLALLVGGVVTGLAVLGAVLVYLAPVPRLRVALAVVLAVGLAGSCAWLAEAGPGRERRWSPDGAPAWGLLALTDSRLALEASLPIDPSRREAFVLAQGLRAAREQGGLRVAALFGRRLVVDQIGPARFAAHERLALPAALLDALLRGGALLFAAATLALLRPGEESSLPRAGLVTGLLLLALLSVAGATSPFALAPLDLVTAALAAVGVCGSQPRGSRTRWLGFLVGGAMMASFVVTAAITDQQPSPWSRRVQHDAEQGQRLVALLRGGGPRDAAGHMQAAWLLSDASAPFLRLPEAALRHAEEAVLLAPDDPQALVALVRAALENLEFDRARDMASTLIGPEGNLTPQARVLLGGIGEAERRWQGERLP